MSFLHSKIRHCCRHQQQQLFFSSLSRILNHKQQKKRFIAQLRSSLLPENSVLSSLNISSLNFSTSSSEPPADEPNQDKGDRLIISRPALTEEQKNRLLERMEAQKLYSENSRLDKANKVVAFALTMNLVDFSIKLVAWYFTQSNALLAEVIHSCTDMLNQIILYYANYVAARKPDKEHPYGYGNFRNVGSLVAGSWIFSFGGVASIYNGVSGVFNPTQLEHLNMGIGLLCMSAALQFSSWIRAFREVWVHAHKDGFLGPMGVFRYIWSGVEMDPSLKVILFEDSASLAGVLIALSTVWLSSFSGNPIFDSCGSICIGALLSGAALMILRTNAYYLVGQSVPEAKRNAIVKFMAQDPDVKRVHDVKVIHTGNGIRLKAEIDWDGGEIARKLLKEDCDMEQLLAQVKSIQNKQQLEQFLMEFGDQLVDKNGKIVDRVEEKIRQRYPSIRHVDLESM